jgi:hypothetical protein
MQQLFYQGTIPVGISSLGEITGTYADSDSKRHGFVQTATGALSTVDDPNAGTAAAGAHTSYIQGTYGIGVNAGGTLSGTYIHANYTYHGFTRSPSGVFTTLDAPGAGTGMLGGTIGLGMNDSGPITGTWIDSNFTLHGFLYTPQSTQAVAPTFTVTPAASPIRTAQALSVTAAVSGGSGNSIPTGSVTLTSGSYTSAAATLSSGSAARRWPASRFALSRRDVAECSRCSACRCCWSRFRARCLAAEAEPQRLAAATAIPARRQGSTPSPLPARPAAQPPRPRSP